MVAGGSNYDHLNPHPVGVVMWAGYAGPGGVWLYKPLTAILCFELLPQLRV